MAGRCSNVPNGILTAVCCLTIAAFASIAAAEDYWAIRLENGMRVLVIEDHSYPQAASVITIRAGSHTESPGTNGISHLLEHLLFDGTTTRTGTEIKAEVPALGGYFNAYTRKDYVAFEIVMPAELLTAGLEIQADQLLNSTIPQSELEREKKVVCEEIAQSLRDPSSAAEEAAMRILFGNTGYGLPVLGNYQTVMDMPRDRIVGFYRTRYTPNNMTAVIVGDLDPYEVIETLRRLYGSVPSGPEREGIPQLPQFPPDGMRETLAMPVSDDAVLLVLAGPGMDQPEYHAFEIAVSIWADSPSSPLQTRMKPMADQVYAAVSPYNGFSLLQIAIHPGPELLKMDSDTRLATLETALADSIADFGMMDISEQEVTRRIRSRRVDYEFAKEKFNHLARDIGSAESLGIWSYPEFTRAVRDVTPASVLDSFLGAVTGRKPVSVWVSASPDQPAAEPVPLTEPVVRTLENGLTIISSYDPNADLAAIHLLTPNVESPIPGLPRIVAELLNTGTSNMTGEQIAQELLERGIRVKLADWPWLPFDDYYDSIEYNYLQMECLSEDFESALRLMGAMAFDSTLPETAWQEVQPMVRKLSEDAHGSPSAVSRRLLRQQMFESPFYRQPRIPLPQDAETITVQMLREYYRNAYRPSACIVACTGNVLPEKTIAIAQRVLGSLPSESAMQAPSPILAKPGRNFAEVDDPVTYIRAALPLDAGPETIPEWSVVAAMLSETLQQEIRGKQGKSYRLGAWLNEMKGCTFLEIGVGTRGENLEDVEKTVRGIIDSIPGLKIESVEAAVNGLVGHEWRYRQRRINRSHFMAWRHWIGYGVAFESGYIRQLESVAVDRVRELLRSVKPATEWYWAVAGRTDLNTHGGEEKSDGAMQ